MPAIGPEKLNKYIVSKLVSNYIEDSGFRDVRITDNGSMIIGIGRNDTLLRAVSLNYETNVKLTTKNVEDVAVAYYADFDVDLYSDLSNDAIVRLMPRCCEEDNEDKADCINLVNNILYVIMQPSYCPAGDLYAPYHSFETSIPLCGPYVSNALLIPNSYTRNHKHHLYRTYHYKTVDTIMIKAVPVTDDEHLTLSCNLNLRETVLTRNPEITARYYLNDWDYDYIHMDYDSEDAENCTENTNNDDELVIENMNDLEELLRDIFNKKKGG
jgi:hypothetical protein